MMDLSGIKVVLGKGVVALLLLTGAGSAFSETIIPPGYENARGAVVDVDKKFAYVWTGTSPGKLMKVELSTLHTVKTLSLGEADGGISFCVIDGFYAPAPEGGVVPPARNFVYCGSEGTGSSGSKIIKVQVSDLTNKGSISLPSSQGKVVSGVVDSARGLAYFGTDSAPGQIVGINLKNFLLVNSLALADGENDARPAVIDRVSGKAYFGAFGNNVSKVVSVNGTATSISRIGSLVLGAGDDHLRSAFFAPDANPALGGVVYFGANGGRRIVKVSVPSLQRIGETDLIAGETLQSSILLNSAQVKNFLNEFPSIKSFVKLDLNQLSKVDVASLDLGANGLPTGILDLVGGFATFVLDQQPDPVTQIKITDLSTLDTTELSSGQSPETSQTPGEQLIGELTAASGAKISLVASADVGDSFEAGVLATNTIYSMRLNARNVNGTLLSLPLGYVTTFASKPGLTLGAVGATTVGLTIDPKGNHHDYTIYVVEKEKEGGKYETLFQTYLLTPEVSGLEQGLTYRFRVRAQNSLGTLTEATDPVTFTLRPSAPTVKGFVFYYENSITASWTKPVGAVSYTMGVSLANETPLEMLKEQPTLDDHAEVTGLSLNTTYYVYVKATNEGGSSDYALLDMGVTQSANPGLALGAVGPTTVELRIDPNGNPPGTGYLIGKVFPDWPYYQMLFTTTSLTPVVSELMPETAYKFRVQAQNHWGNLTDPAEPVSAETIPLPPLPPSLKDVISVGEHSVRTRWTELAGATLYTLAVSLKSDTPVEVVGSSETVNDNGEVTGLSLNTTYYVFVKASNRGGSSDFAFLGTAVTYSEKPGLALGAVGATTVGLTIDPKGNPAGTWYEVEKQVEGEGSYSIALRTTSLTPTLSGLNRGTSLNFRVRAMNHMNSYTDYATAVSVLLSPAEPVSGELKEITHTTAELKWDAAAGAKSYTVYASRFEDDPLKDKKTFNTESTSVMVTDLSPNTTYYLFLQASNKEPDGGVGGESAFVSLGSTITLAAMPELSLDNAKVSINSVGLIIKPNGNPGGTMYEVDANGGGKSIKLMTTELTPNVGGLVAGTPYQFQVRAVNFGGIVTGYSSPVLADTAKPAITTVDAVRAYPVPFRPAKGDATIRFDQMPMDATIRIYSMSGTLVKELREGAENVPWNVKNDAGDDVASGVYFVRVSGSGGDKTFKIVVQR